MKRTMVSACGVRLGWSISLLLPFFVRFSGAAPAVSYCSTDNNAGSYTPMWSEYQSTGLCSDHCQGSFAFAIVQGNNCWCSNYIPAEQEDTLNCNSGCPGISTEWCGNPEAGLYGYFQLPAGKPLGTSGAGASSPSTSSNSVQTATQTAVSSAPWSSTSESSSSYSSSITNSPSSSSPTVPDPATTSSTPTEVYTSITTVTGRVQTVVITPTPSDGAVLGQSSTSGGRGVSTGKVVGIVLGVVLGIGLIIGIILWLWFRRKHRQDRDEAPEGSFIAERNSGNSSVGNSFPSRQVSQMSTSGLLGKAPRIMTSGLVGGSDLRSADTSGSGIDRRSVGTDQRLNPWALYSQEDRSSHVSLHDNQDYSRQLRVANPDA